MTWIIDVNIESGSTDNYCPAKNKSSKVVINSARIVERDVIVIDKGKFPLAKYTIMFEDVPPDTNPSKTRFTANSVGRFKR